MAEFEFPLVETFVGGLLAFLLGLIWYHPKFLGKRWVEARGKSLDDMKPTPLPLVVSFMLWLLASFFFSFIVGFHNVDSPEAYLALASLLWVAFAMPPTLMGAFYTGYPFEAVSIDSAYQLGGYYILAGVHIVSNLLM